MQSTGQLNLKQSGIKVLVVEDDEVDRALIRRTLEQTTQGYVITEATSCVEGLVLIGEQTFDCVLLDLNLTDGESIDVLIALEKSDNMCPVIILTGEETTDARRHEVFSRGAQDFLEKQTLSPAMLSRALEAAIERHNHLQHMQRDRKTYEWLATQDPLTGLLNRRGLERTVERLHSELRPDQTLPFHVLLVDCDDFKGINGQYGHAAGDRALKCIGAQLRDQVRAGDVVSRIGGDEMMILLNQHDLSGTLRTAERLRRAISETLITWDDSVFRLTVSIGVAPYPAGVQSVTELLKITQKALASSKGAGKNCVHVAPQTASDGEPERFEDYLQAKIAQAAQDGEIFVETPTPFLQTLDPMRCLSTLDPSVCQRTVLRIPARDLIHSRALEARLAPLRAAGVTIELDLEAPDDISHLLHFLPDRLHIPDHMIDGVSEHSEARQTLERLVLIAERLGVRVTGELVKNHSDRAIIEDLGVSTPMPLSGLQMRKSP
ncbi:MAG: diguanylate cyclase [Bradymonadia bacterium]